MNTIEEINERLFFLNKEMNDSTDTDTILFLREIRELKIDRIFKDNKK